MYVCNNCGKRYDGDHALKHVFPAIRIWSVDWIQAVWCRLGSARSAGAGLSK